MVQQYLKHSRDILSSGRFEFNERRRTGRIYLFGYQNRYDLSAGLPLLTTKKLPFKVIAHELMWFLRGDTNIKYLVDNGVHIWDDDAFNYNLKEMVEEKIFPEEFKKYSKGWLDARKIYVQGIKEDNDFAARWGGLGPVYGAQWIHWPKFSKKTVKLEGGEEKEVYIKDEKGINQIESLIEGMRKNITSARHIVTAWNPAEVHDMSLPPCHTLFQLHSDGEKLDLQLYQRACDMFLGVPFNIASYSLLTMILANELGLKPGEFIHDFGDVHFYTGASERANWYKDNLEELSGRVKSSEDSSDYLKVLDWVNKSIPNEDDGKEGMDHVPGILEQLSREPRPLPRVIIADKHYSKLTIDDFVLDGYNPHPPIKGTLAV